MRVYHPQIMKHRILPPLKILKYIIIGFENQTVLELPTRTVVLNFVKPLQMHGLNLTYLLNLILTQLNKATNCKYTKVIYLYVYWCNTIQVSIQKLVCLIIYLSNYPSVPVLALRRSSCTLSCCPTLSIHQM